MMHCSHAKADLLTSLQLLPQRVSVTFVLTLSASLCKTPCCTCLPSITSHASTSHDLRYVSNAQGCSAYTLVPDGCRFAITGSEDSTARVWDLQAPPRLDDQNHAGKVHCMSVAPDGATAVSVAADGCAMVWDVQSGNCRHILKGHATALHWASLASNGRTLLTVAGDRMIKAWDIVTGSCGATLPSKPSSTLCVNMLLPSICHLLLHGTSLLPLRRCSACHATCCPVWSLTCIWVACYCSDF